MYLFRWVLRKLELHFLLFSILRMRQHNFTPSKMPPGEMLGHHHHLLAGFIQRRVLNLVLTQSVTTSILSYSCGFLGMSPSPWKQEVGSLEDIFNTPFPSG